MLHCPVEGDPPFVITWTKNGRNVRVDGSRVMQYDNGSLVIYDASVSVKLYSILLSLNKFFQWMP